MSPSQKTLVKEVLIFSGITLLLTYGIGFTFFLMGTAAPLPAMTASMPIPALVSFALYLVWKKPLFKKENDLGFRIPKISFLFTTPTVMFLLILSSCVISMLLSPALLRGKDEILNSLSKFTLNANPYLNLFLILLLNIFLAPIINFPIFLGEELGWRGFLTPRLLKLTTPAVAFLLSGIIWGLWHVFGILMGHNYPGHPLLGTFMMILLCIPMGVILQYYFLKSGSIFIPMVAHGAINWTAVTLLSYFANPEILDPLIFGPTGVIGIVIFWLVGLVYFKRYLNLQEEMN